MNSFISSDKLREKFLEFFKNKSHTVVESDLLVPKDDPTLLFTGAGMNQFKEQFMGRDISYARAVSCQKCLRTADIENVGRTPSHHTFFEMLGNFSFGDYFKREAIQWAWEFMTGQLALPDEKLWVSVYRDDAESYSIWRDKIKVLPERIVKLGPKDNFWPENAQIEGPNGPCGPCSEIFYDWGAGVGCGKKSCTPACSCGRFVEVWNLVFTEFDRKPDASLAILPNKNIDTGMGLERIASVIQGVKTNFETDLFKPIVKEIKKELADRGQFPDAADIYLIADHIRAIVFAVADGVLPSNEKRGYVVRKLIRKACLKSGEKKPFLYNIVFRVADVMKYAYPELREKVETLSVIIKEEEQKFCEAMASAMPILKNMISEGAGKLAGRQVFKLVDTYGLPLEVIEAVVPEGVCIEKEVFTKLMEKRRESSRKGSDMCLEFIFQPDYFKDVPRPANSSSLPLLAELVFILQDTKAQDMLREGDYAEIITNPQSSEFYAESGGQTGSSGTISSENALMDIVNTFEVDGKKVFAVRVRDGYFKKGDKITVCLDSARKRGIARNHTATHLLQAALRSVLGNSVKQSGSYVDDKRLRFDFTHMKKVPEQKLIEVERLVNEWISESLPVSKEYKTLKEAQKEGALSFFGEKYEDTVRVISIGEKSKELCGGTHVDTSSEIGLVKIISESSAASGIRRVEAVTGQAAEDWIKNTLRDLLSELKNISVPFELGIEDEIAIYVEKIVKGEIKIDRNVARDFEERIKPAILRMQARQEEAAKKLHKQKESQNFDKIKKKIDVIASCAEKFGGINFISGVLEDADMVFLCKSIGYLEKKSDSAVIFLGANKDSKAYLVCALTPDLEGKGINACEIINKALGNINGRGGGKPMFAQAGGTNPQGLEKAIKEVRSMVEKIGSF